MIYLVRGITGEGCDRMTWLVAAYKEENTARQHANRAEACVADWLAAHGKRNRFGDWPYETARACQEAGSPYDPYLKVDYTGTYYEVVAVPLLEQVPSPEQIFLPGLVRSY